MYIRRRKNYKEGLAKNRPKKQNKRGTGLPKPKPWRALQDSLQAEKGRPRKAKENKAPLMGLNLETRKRARCPKTRKALQQKLGPKKKTWLPLDPSSKQPEHDLE